LHPYLSRPDVSWRQNILKFVRKKKLLEFIRNVHSPLRDVQVSNYEHELYHVKDTCGRLLTSPSLIAIF
jgi:hypothetical protein